MKSNCISRFLLISILFNLSFQKFLELEKEPLLLATDDCKDKTFSAIEKNVKITGRFYQKEDTTWLVQSGSSIEFYISGQKTGLILVGDQSIYAGPDFRPRFAVYVDDKLLLDSTMNELELNIDLSKAETDKKIKVKVMLLSENNNGGIGVKSINTYICSNSYPIEPVEKKKLKIEFLGDSITCAYGVEGKDQNENFKTTTENSSKSYAYLASQMLDADYSIVCYSGSGIISGYSNGEKNTQNLFPPHYKKASRNSNYPGDWDFEGNRNDVVFINLGTNDKNYVTAQPSTRNDEFIQEYVKFLTAVRKDNPDSYIICTLGTLGCEEIYKLIEQAVQLFGDKKVSYFLSPSQNMNTDGIGSDWHPSAITHQKLSKLVVEKINAVLK
jgi:lysophospholipase L1-like esterase